MAKKCKDCDPNKYIEGLAYRGSNGYSFDGFNTYNDIGQPYGSDGKPSTDMLANVNDMLDSYNPIFSSSSTKALPPSANNPISVKGVDAKAGFWFIWSFVDGLVTLATPGIGPTAPAITSSGQTSTKLGGSFAFDIVTDQVPSRLSYTDFGLFADSSSSDRLRFDSIIDNTVTLRKTKVNRVGYYTGYIVSQNISTTATYTSKKSLTIFSNSSDGKSRIRVTSRPTLATLLGQPVSYTITTAQHAANQFDAIPTSSTLISIANSGLIWNGHSKTITGIMNPALSKEIKTDTWTFNIRSKIDADSGNAVQFNLNIVRGQLNSTLALPTVSSRSYNGTVGAKFSQSLSGLSRQTVVGITELPEGLSFNSSKNTITGAPIHAGTFVVYVSCSNAKGNSALQTLTFNIAPYELNNKPSGATYPSEIKFLQNSYNTIKNNKITLKLNSSPNPRAANFSTNLKFKKITKNEYVNIKKNGIPDRFTGTFVQQANSPYITIYLSAQHKFKVSQGYQGIEASLNNSGKYTFYPITSIIDETSFVVLDFINSKTTRSGNVTVNSYTVGRNITEVFNPILSLDNETSFWLFVTDPDRKDRNYVDVGGTYDLDYASISQIDALGNACFAPQSGGSGPVSTPITQNIDVTASNCIKGGVSPNPEENLPTIGFNPGPDIEHQVIFTGAPEGGLNTTSSLAQQRLTKSGLLKYPNGIPQANGTYLFYVNFTDICAFNTSIAEFPLYIGTYSPRAGDVYSCYYFTRVGSGRRTRTVKTYQNTTLSSAAIPGNCDGGVVSRIGNTLTYKNYGFQYRNTLLESKDIGITSLTNISILDILGEGPIEGIVDYEIVPKPGFKKGDIGYVNGVDLKQYKGQNSYIRSIYWNETALADNTYDDPGSVNFEFIKLKFDNGDGAPRHVNINELSNINLEEEFYSRKSQNGAYVNYLKFLDQNKNILADAVKLPKRLTSTKTVGTKLLGKRKFQDGTERSYKKSINVLTKDLYALKLHIKAISLFKQIVDLRIFDSAKEAEDNSEGGRIDRQSMTFNLTLKRIDKGANSAGLEVSPVNTSQMVLTGRLNSGAYIETFEWSGLNKISNENTIGWEIEIEPTYIESVDGNIVLKSGIDSVTEVYNEFLALPHSAGILTTFDARFFTNIPQRAYDVRMLKVKIPSNYNPFSKTYDGVWDGTFKLAWTDNPAWCFYDLLTNKRYGLGKYVDPQYTDKWTMYEISKYCDELVSDGKGGLEPRFTCNVLISTREDAYKVINDMASIFRAIIYYSAGLIMASQDRPKEPIYLFNNSNVKDGEFTYSNTSKRVRRNVALVRYNDKDNFYKPAVKYVENREGLIRYGIRETEVSAFGCTSEGQAERLGKWTLLSENFESELISFETSLPGMYLKPGDIVLVQDQNRQNKVLGGRTYQLDKNFAILDVKYSDLSGFLPAISGCKFNVLTPAGNVELSTDTGKFLTDFAAKTGDYINAEFSTSEGIQSGINTSLIRRKQIQTIEYNILSSGDGSINTFGMYVSEETGNNFNGYARLDFGGESLDNKEHTLLQNTVWTIELDPNSYNYLQSPSISGRNSALYPGAYLEPYIDKTQKFRILDIEEQEEYRYKVTALQYDELKYELGDNI